MSPGSGNRQTGTIPKTKVRNNCNVPQEAVTPTRRDIHLGNLVTTSLDLVPVPEYSVNSSQNRNRRTGIDDGSIHHDYAESLVHEGGRFVPVRPQPRTPIPKAPVAHRECPVFSRYRDSMASSEQMDDSFGSPNPYFTGQNQRQNNAAAVMIVNPTTANSGNQQIQPNAENYQNANSIVVRNNSIGRTNFTSNRTSSQPRAQATKTMPNHNNTVTIGPSVSNAPKASNIIHNGFNPASIQTSSSAPVDHQDHRLPQPGPHSVEFELGQIRGYIRATSNLVHDLRAVENEEAARPASVQSNCSGYSENELFQNELRVKLEKSQQKIQALQDQQKQLLMCQQAAKSQLAKMSAALVNKPSHDNEQPFQLNCMAAANGMLSDAGTNTQNYQQIHTINREQQQLDLGFTSTSPQYSDFNNHHLRDFNQQVNAMQTERFIRNQPQVSQGTSLQENYTEGCQPFRLERLSNNMGEIVNSQGSDSEGEEDSRRIQHSVELQQKLLELQAKTAHIENMFANFKKDQGASGSMEPSILNDTHRKSRRSNSSSLSPVAVTHDAPHNYTYSQDNTMQSHSSDDDSRRENNGAGIDNDLMSNETAQINVMEMKLEKLKGMMQTVASIENRLATSVLDEPSHAPNVVQQLNNLDNMYARSAMGEPSNPVAVEVSNECNSRNRYEDINQAKHQNYNANLSSRRFNDTSTANKCRNIEDQNPAAHKNIATSMTAMNELTEQLKREVRDIADQREKLRCAAARAGQYPSEAHAGDPASPDRKSAREAQFDDRKRRLHSYINRGHFNSTEDSPESPRGRQSEVQSQQSHQSQRSQRSSVSVTSLSSHQVDRTPHAHTCACQPHHGFSSEQDEEEASTVSLVHRKNMKNTPSSTSCARAGQQDRSVHCTHSPISTPDQYKEESTYCDSAHSLDTSAVIPNPSSSSNHNTYRVARPHSKQRQRHSCSSRIEHESRAASDESAGSIPCAPPPPMSPMPQHIHRHRWPNAYFLHADGNIPAKESSCSGGETSTSMGPNITDTQRSWWQQNAEQLQQQLEQTCNMCQTLLQDRRFSQHRHNEHSQTLEPAPAGVSCPAPPTYPGTFMLPYGVMVPMSGDISGMTGNMSGTVGAGPAGGATGGAWWALAGYYNQLNSQQWEISTLRNSLMMLEEKYSSLANAVNHRAHSTPPHVPTLDECLQQQTIRTRSALSNHHAHNLQQHHQTPGNPQHRYHPSSGYVDNEHPVIHQRNFAQDHGNYHTAANAHSWTSHEGRAPTHDPPHRATPNKVATQQQYVTEEIQPSNASYDFPNATIFNNCAPPAMPNPNIMNSVEPQLIQNNTNPNCLLSLIPAQQNPVNHLVTSSPAGPSAPAPESSQNMALNNQVPPGNRANNYWDNFRSYSRQNLLSGSSKTNADSSSAAFTLHNPQPLAERSHNTLHSSSTNNNVTHNTPTNTPKRNINSASANTSNLSQTNNASSQIPTEAANRRGRRNITQESSIFAAPPDVLNVNQNSEIATETELNSVLLNEDSTSRFNASVNFNVNREYDSLHDRNINVVNPIPEILVSHTNNFLNMGGNKRKSSSKLPAKNTSTNYSLEQHTHNRNIDITGGAEVPNLNLASASSSRSQDKSTSKLFDLLRENVYSEVTALISANESHPHFLIQLFRDLQQIRSDPLRQRMLASIQEVSHDGIFIEEHSQNLPGSTLPSADQAVTSSTEFKFSTGNTNTPTANINSQIISFISTHKGLCSNEFITSLSNLIQSVQPAEFSPPDFVDRINLCLSKYENANVPDASESMLADITNLIEGEINSGIDKANDIKDESNMQDVAGSLERTFVVNPNDDLDNTRQTSDYGEGDPCLPPVVSLPSCSHQPDQNGFREGIINAQRSSEPKIDLIESAEVCNGDLAEADQSRHNESISDHAVGAVGGEVVVANLDALPDVVDTEEQTPTEAEAEWLGLDRVPTRLHPEDGPENQTESGHG